MDEIKYREEEEVVTIIHRLVDIKYGDIEETIDLDLLRKKKNLKISDQETDEKKKLINVFQIDEKNYYIYTSKTGRLYITNNVNYFCKIKQKIHCKITKKYVYFWGKFTNINHKVDNFNQIFLNENKVGKIKRFSKMKKLKDFMVMRIKVSDLINSGEIHNNIRIGKSKEISVPILIKRKHKGTNYFNRKKIKDNYIIVRSICNGNKVRITSIKFEPEYKKINLIKNFLAKIISKMYMERYRNTNLMFEKETNRACESRILHISKDYGFGKK
ncbi:MAG: hypothetical protein IJ690_02825 [Clostridia bacterium]|nr:hypothetical protein [Clostridia bacterium]